MAEVSFQELMQDAEQGSYGVGYFEAWNMESLCAAADAAERMGSPVILGFSGIYLPHPLRLRTDDLSHYSALVKSVVASLRVPACSIFNESANFEWVLQSIELGFSCTMYTDGNNSFREQTDRVRKLVETARPLGTAVEGEASPLPGAGGEAVEPGSVSHESALTRDIRFVEETGIDAYAPDIGQEHVHGRRAVHLNFDRLSRLREHIGVPLVLHGASSISDEEIRKAIALGIRKINVGSSLKRTYFQALKEACFQSGEDYNPYEIIGSGLEKDVLMQGRMALEKKIGKLMVLFNSAGRF